MSHSDEHVVVSKNHCYHHGKLHTMFQASIEPNEASHVLLSPSMTPPMMWPCEEVSLNSIDLDQLQQSITIGHENGSPICSSPSEAPIMIRRHKISATLNVDTALANKQSLRKNTIHSHQSKTKLTEKLFNVIRNDDFENFSAIINHQKPDLNVFLDGQTALHYCLLFGRDVSWCEHLVKNGANPNLSNQDGWHPLHLAASKGLKETLSYLISCSDGLKNRSQAKSIGTVPSQLATYLAKEKTLEPTSSTKPV